MRILLLCSAYNGLTQRVHTELTALGHEVSVELALDDEVVRQGISLYQPDLIICPFLRQRIPEDICRNNTCIIVHPGIKGDRGPSSLDWAIQEGVEEWGVTALQATGEMDAGDIWSSSNFKMRRASKNSIYGVEVTEVAVKVVLETVARFQEGQFKPEPLDYSRPEVKGRLRPMMKQSDRHIDWTSDPMADIIAKINAADGNPGVLDTLEGEEFYLYGAHAEGILRGRPGAILAQRYGAICRAAIDGAVWISHLKRRGNNGQQYLKLPATLALGQVSEAILEAPIESLYDTLDTYREIGYEEINEVGYLHFDFYNGAMSTDQCRRLERAFLKARKRPTKVIVLMGGRAAWSNGIHLNVIEAAQDPAAESWRNIQAMDDLIRAILTTESQLTVAAVHGNAGAGGVPLALACDKALVRKGVIFNPHYKTMGLFGSEYWTYSLPKRVGRDKAIELTEGCRAVGMREAQDIGLVDGIISGSMQDFDAQVVSMAETMASRPKYLHLNLQKKSEKRRRDERVKPLERYRAEELERMWANFYSPKSDYHHARQHFVYKRPPSEIPLHLARHRRRRSLIEIPLNWWDKVRDRLIQLWPRQPQEHL